MISCLQFTARGNGGRGKLGVSGFVLSEILVVIHHAWGAQHGMKIRPFSRSSHLKIYRINTARALKKLVRRT
jgi:hypothetical protein